MHLGALFISLCSFYVLLTNCRYEEERNDEGAAVSTYLRRRSTHEDVWPSDFRLIAPSLSSIAASAQDDIQVLDIAVLASIDGKLHGVHRGTGQILWSMANSAETSATSPSTFDPLIRTEHSAHDSDRELFIIEPQSGDIYVLPSMASPSEPLQRLSMSVQQLVELSPFSFPGDDERTFVGRKETSMMVVELETGRLKGTVNSEMECFWDDEQQEEEVNAEIDLDELDGTKEPTRKLKPREIHIGRTDYHIRVHIRHEGVVQNLFYSSYGPNNIDKELQSKWKRTPDHLYIQSVPNGQVLAFQTDDSDSRGDYDGMPIWGREFRQPIVAVFDVVTYPSRSNPVALLQPRPHLEHIFPRKARSKTPEAQDLPPVTYVGVIDGSLFAMSHENFPLVVFDQTPPLAVPETEKGKDVQGVCKGVGCLVGSRRMEMDKQQWGMPPLLDAVPGTVQPEKVPLNPRISPAEPETNESQTGIGDRNSEAVAGIPLVWKGGLMGLTLLLTMAMVKIGFGRTRNGTSVVVSQGASALNKDIQQNGDTPEKLEAEKPPVETLDATVLEPPLEPPLPPISTDEPAVEVALNPGAAPIIPNSSPSSSSNNNNQEAQLPQDPASLLAEGDAEGDESEKESATGAPRRKRLRRRKRPGKKKAGVEREDDEKDDAQVIAVANVGPVDLPISPAVALVTPSTPRIPIASSQLVVSENVLGFGSQGTVVYEGSLQGRAVAVKRLLQDFVTIAAREVELLQESDDHPNVIRYFYKEFKDGFLYIALELCPASLADLVERPDAFPNLKPSFDPKRALSQITAGLKHLHTLKIVHRDIKPQNILVSRPGRDGQHRMLISDFGLCKKLEVDQTSFLPTVHGMMGAGTFGWRAPEILRGDVKLDEQPMDPDDASSSGSTRSAGSSTTEKGSARPRLTKSVDIFALGCLFYYTLTGGSHPFGDRFEREVNILRGKIDLCGLEQFEEEGTEAANLIQEMLHQEAKKRPDTTACLIHPFFWTSARRLNFLQEASDKFEILPREPRDRRLIRLETGAFDVVGPDWHTRLDRIFVENLGKFRKYDGRSVQDLMRALRNKKHHYQDLPDNVKRHLGPLPEGFLGYFTRRFPILFLHVWTVVRETGMANESEFRHYFELSEAAWT